MVFIIVKRKNKLRSFKPGIYFSVSYLMIAHNCSWFN